jgi:energy-coupling factor transporter ATP-binding protein EcfA2
MSRDALVVGINSYTYERLSSLTAPAQDAEAVAKLLENYGGFNVKRLPAVKDKQNNTIRVGQKTQVTLTQLEAAIVQLFKPEGRNIPDTALLYFSGHGLRKNQGIQEGFLATSDTNPDMGNWGLRLKWLRELLQESEVKQQIIWLDCCYSGELLKFDEADPGDRGKGRDRCFIAASREFEPAFEEIGKNHSVLTAALLQALEPKEKQVTNYTVVDVIDQNIAKFPQRPIFANSGGIIHLTRTQTKIEPVREIAENAVTSNICPYRGLQYFDFTEADAKYFYGRQAVTDTLIEKVRQNNFLAVLGASGSGKSSVVRAGLLYQLQQGRKLSGSDTWQIRIFRPGEHPLQSLAQAFLDRELSDIQRASKLQQAEELINKGSQGLGQLIDAASGERVVLVLDQFEEVFTLCQNSQERQHFFDCLLTALQRCGRKFCLVLTMRADFFGKCAEYEELAAKIQENLLTVTPMNRQELEQAITTPAKQVNLTVEPELVEQIIDDMGDSPGILPLLQYTLTEIWQQRTGEGKLTLATYSRLGGVKGTLQKRATEVYEGFSGEEQEAAKRIFLELTQLGEGTEDTRRRVLLRDLVPGNNGVRETSVSITEQVIQKLADARLIVTQEEFVDVAHEALIRHWLLLRKWLDENRDRLREKRKIETAAKEWRYQGRKKDYLLSGEQLKNAKAWQKGEGKKLGLSKLAEEFIKASEQHRLSRFLLTASWMTIPILVAFTPSLGQQKHYTALQNAALLTIKTQKQAVTKEALELLSEGCWIPKWMSGNFVTTALFGKCHDLYGANLSNINLTSANLYSANLSNTNLRSANLSNADFRGADLRGSNLSNADFRGVDFRGVNLKKATYNKKTKLPKNFDPTREQMLLIAPGVNLKDADLSFINFWDADFQGIKLTNANLEGSNLSNVENFTPEQVKAAKNWEKAIYDEEFRKKLGLK